MTQWRPISPAPSHQEFLADPYRLYRRLREVTPVHRVGRRGGLELWLVTGYPEARAALTEPALSKCPRHVEALQQAVTMDPTFDLGSHMLNTDPPDHTRLRQPVTRAFSSRRVELLRPRIVRIVDELLHTMAPLGRAELLTALAFPLSMTVICELLGVPVDDRNQFREWSHAALTPPYAEQETASRAEAIAALREYFTDLLVRRRAELRGEQSTDAQPDLLSALLMACDDEGRLTEAELVATATLMLVAGHDSSQNLIGNGMLALLRHPDQFALLRERPELLPGAVEELLRYDGPGETAGRIVARPVRIGGHEVPTGAVINVGLGAANRDPRQFADPERLDITRQHNPHLAFGHGAHYCVGAALARLEAQVAIGELVSRFPDLALADPPERLQWRVSMFRGLSELPVTFTDRSLRALT